MYQKDYILRLIEEASKVLREILSLGKEGKFDDAIELINEAFISMLDINKLEIKNKDTHKLIAFLVNEKEFSLDKMRITADLLIEDEKYIDNLDEKKNILEKVSVLLNYLNVEDKTFSFERVNKIKYVNEQLLKFQTS